MSNEERESIIYAAGQIVGLLLRWPTAAWREAAEQSSELRTECRRSLIQLARLREEILAGVQGPDKQLPRMGDKGNEP